MWRTNTSRPLKLFSRCVNDRVRVRDNREQQSGHKSEHRAAPRGAFEYKRDVFALRYDRRGRVSANEDAQVRTVTLPRCMLVAIPSFAATLIINKTEIDVR